MLAMLGVSVYILADTFFIARALGPTGLTALNFAIVIFSLIQGAGLMIGTGGAIDFSVRVSRSGKSGDKPFYNALILAGAFAVLFMLAGSIFSREISLFLGADSETLAPTRVYVTTILLFSPLFLANNILLAFVRNDQEPGLAMNAMLVSSLANILLDYIFMFPLGMGMFGAALATAVSPLISMMILMVHFRAGRSRFRLRRKRAEAEHILRIMVLGVPSLITELAAAVTLFTFNIVILRLAGNIGVAAYGVIANVAIIATALFTGLAQGIQPLASHYFAASDSISLRKILKYGVITANFLSVVLIGAVVMFSEPIVAIFNGENNRELALIADQGIQLYFAGFLFAGINIILISYLSATLKTSQAIWISVLRSSLILIPVVLIMSHFFGLTGIWLSFLLTEFIVLALSLISSISNSKKIIAP